MPAPDAASDACAASAARGAPTRASGPSSTSTPDAVEEIPEKPVQAHARRRHQNYAAAISRATSRSTFPLIERFREQGATDYLAQIVGFGLDGVRRRQDRRCRVLDHARAGGFTERDVAILEHLISRLALALQARLGYDITVNLLDTYVGPEAGRRILDGEIRRGLLEVIPAVIFYADLRGFTALADRTGTTCWSRC